MTKAEQFEQLATKILEAYQKESASAIALAAKYSDAWNVAKQAKEAAKKAYDNAESKARAERAAVRDEGHKGGQFDWIEKTTAMREQWHKDEKPLLESWNAANEAEKAAYTRANLTAIPVVNIQAVYILKLYAAFFEVYTNAGEVKRQSPRLDCVKKYVKLINERAIFGGRIDLCGASAMADPFTWEGYTNAQRAAGALENVQSDLNSCLKSEADILSRAELIERATAQLEAFKATYQKAGKALAGLMEGLASRQSMFNEYTKISFY